MPEVLMTAGAGALLNQVFSIPIIVGSGLMAVCLALVALWGVKGVSGAFSVIVPLLIVVAMITGVLSFFCFDRSNIVARPFSGANSLLGSIVGFKELIAVLFPVCGYIGFFAMIGISLHFLSLKKKIDIDVRAQKFNYND